MNDESFLHQFEACTLPKECLASAAARREWCEPDLKPLHIKS
jgi:hypothetical protein